MKTLQSSLLIAVFALALIALAPRAALANGMFIQEMSASGMAQGGAVVAGGDRPSSLFQNAANLAFIPGFNLEFTGTTYFPTGTITDPQGVKTHPKSDGIFTPHLFFSAKITDWLTFGFGEFVDFGLATTWPKGWAADYVVLQSGLNSFTFNPNLAFGPWKGFAFAVGFDAKWGSVTIERALTTGDVKGRMKMGGSAWGFGANAGLMYQPAWWVRMGAGYRTGINMKLDNGKVDFEVPEAFGPRFPDQKFKASISLPHLISMGVRFWAIKNTDQELSFEADGWATLWKSYDKLQFKFNKGLGGYYKDQYNIKEQINYQNYMQTGQARVGAEYKFLQKHLAARLGFLWDGNPAPATTVSPMMPDYHRIMPTMGIGGEYKGFYVDLAYMPVINLPRTVDNKDNPYPMKVKFITHDFSFSLGYAFDYFAKKPQGAIPAQDLPKPAAPVKPEVVPQPPLAPAPEAAPVAPVAPAAPLAPAPAPPAAPLVAPQG